MNAQIGAIVEAYEELYQPERPCGCTEDNPYPHNIDNNGKPAVCLAHEWERQQRIHQARLMQNQLSLPIPPQVRWDDKTQKAIEEAKDDIHKNPIHSRKVHLKKVHDDGAMATNLAWYLSQSEWQGNIARRGHIVVYLDKSTVITNTFQQRETEMREVISFAPVLVYWDNRDNRNGSWILNTVRSRPNGLAFVVR